MTDDALALAALLCGLALIVLGIHHEQPSIAAVGLIAILTGVLHAHGQDDDR